MQVSCRFEFMTINAEIRLPGQANYTAAQYQIALMADELPNTVCIAVPPVVCAHMSCICRSPDYRITLSFSLTAVF
jgi:hypothetical protein